MPVRLIAPAELCALYPNPVQRRSLLVQTRALLREDAQALRDATDPPSFERAREAAHRSKGTLAFLGINIEVAAALLDELDRALSMNDHDAVARLRHAALGHIQTFDDDIHAYMHSGLACTAETASN